MQNFLYLYIWLVKTLEKLMELIRENRETEAEELLRTLGGTAEEPEWER